MFERFDEDARATVLAAARREAAAAGHDAVEAEHLLLALASRREIQEFGLDRDALLTALAAEEQRSLAAVGVSAADYRLPAPARSTREPRLATSAKLVLQRAVAVARRRGDRRIRAQHLLLGVLSAEHGRVPRALAIASIDVAKLRAQL
jgi:ATP-dependent Clp protease ATP-binding subunit ClpA